MNTYRLALAIATLWALTGPDSDPQTDTVLQRAALVLWEAAASQRTELLVQLQAAGMCDQAIADFVGVAVATVTRASGYREWHERAQALDRAAYQAVKAQEE